MNPNSHGAGLSLNISETDNAQDLGLALDVANTFGISRNEQERLARLGLFGDNH